MALRTYNPTSAGMRHLVKVDRSELFKGKPVKMLTVGLKKNGGRNNTGRLVIFTKGGGHKKAYRLIDFKRNKLDMPAVVERIEYDPNRTAYIALIKYEDGHLAYILAPQRLAVGDTVISSEKADIKPGNTLPLRVIPVGTIIHNVEMKAGKGGQLARSAGAYAQLVGRSSGYAQIKLSSGEIRMVRAECLATVGAVSNPEHSNEVVGKAGRSRWLGKRPSVRGIAMNPIDHPHGGRGNGGRHPCTPWGKPTRGRKTRYNKKTDRLIVRRRNKK